jgi:hypothetical protein
MPRPSPQRRPTGFGPPEQIRIIRPRFTARRARRIAAANPISEHALYIHLFVTNAGGW